MRNSHDIRAGFLPVLLLLVLLVSCNRNKLCTMEYREIYITVTDSSGKAVLLDSTYTEIVSTKKKITGKTDSLNKIKGMYLLFSDSQKDMIGENTETDFKFFGLIGSAIVVEENYLITQDGCHIKLLTGNTNIILKQ